MCKCNFIQIYDSLSLSLSLSLSGAGIYVHCFLCPAPETTTTPVPSSTNPGKRRTAISILLDDTNKNCKQKNNTNG